MTQWQHLYLHEHVNMHNLFEMIDWCCKRHGDPICLPNWIQQKMSVTGSSAEWGTFGGWTRDWRDTGYSFWHAYPNFWAQLRREPHAFRVNYLELSPLCVMFYNREDLAEFKLIWT